MEVEIKAEIMRQGDKYTVLTSHNGYQWFGGGMNTLQELEQIRDALTKFISEQKDAK